jgi:hypothetical protein
MRGRWPSGPEYIDKLLGDAESKERLKAVLDTLYGQARLLEVCDQLDIRETRFHQLRWLALQGALSALMPRPAGRPSRASASQSEEIHALKQRVAELERALLEAQVREEIALVLPHLQRTDGHGERETGEEKKMPPRRVKVHKPR